MIVDPVDRRRRIAQIAAASLRTFMRLPVAQRSSVILMDVLGYSLDEIGGVMDSTIPAVKAALHRGRARLRELAQEPEDVPLPVLAERRARAARRLRRPLQRARLRRRPRHARRRGAARARRQSWTEWSRRGRKVLPQLRPAAGLALRVRLGGRAPGGAGARARDAVRTQPTYFVLLEWTGGAPRAASAIFAYARYATDGAELVVLD